MQFQYRNLKATRIVRDLKKRLIETIINGAAQLRQLKFEAGVVIEIKYGNGVAHVAGELQYVLCDQVCQCAVSRNESKTAAFERDGYGFFKSPRE